MKFVVGISILVVAIVLLALKSKLNKNLKKYD